MRVYVYKIIDKETKEFYIGSHQQLVEKKELEITNGEYITSSTNQKFKAKFAKNRHKFDIIILEDHLDSRDDGYKIEEIYIKKVYKDPKCLNRSDTPFNDSRSNVGAIMARDNKKKLPKPKKTKYIIAFILFLIIGHLINNGSEEKSTTANDTATAHTEKITPQGNILNLKVPKDYNGIASLCEADVLYDIAAIEDESSLQLKGSVIGGITQYDVSDNVAQFCVHGGYCYPRYITNNDGNSVEAVKLNNCIIDVDDSLSLDKSKISREDLLYAYISDFLEDHDFYPINADNIAISAIKNPNSKCANEVYTFISQSATQDQANIINAVCKDNG